ncbi:MAG: hypothetical protein M1822_007503 [Bathelium mastoideum]|nr:MAG: hypothetical protein M1822_007503 [Bathelium mastoideum]
MPSAEEIVKEMLLYVLDPEDMERAFVKFEANDDVAMLINNFGGLSNLELEALADLVRAQLQTDWKIVPRRIYASTFETSLNGPGFSITLGNLSNIARGMDMTSSEVLDLLDAPTSAPAWPKNGYENARVRQELKFAESQGDEHVDQTEGLNIRASQKLAVAVLAACKAALAAEPEITKYDVQMGDGDCGEAVSGVCNAIAAKIDAGLFDQGTIFTQLNAIGDAVEDMGGSLGAIISIVLAAFTNALRQNVLSKTSATLDKATVGKALSPAMENLKLYTGARAGDRTVMDALIPFCDTMQETSNLELAVSAAEEGARATATMKPKFGRASYIGEKDDKNDKPPDPGAYAVAVFLRGLLPDLQ